MKPGPLSWSPSARLTLGVWTEGWFASPVPGRFDLPSSSCWFSSVAVNLAFPGDQAEPEGQILPRSRGCRAAFPAPGAVEVVPVEKERTGCFLPCTDLWVACAVEVLQLS